MHDTYALSCAMQNVTLSQNSMMTSGNYGVTLAMLHDGVEVLKAIDGIGDGGGI